MDKIGEKIKVKCDEVSFMTMGEIIKSKRLERGWTQEYIADMTGVSKTHIYCIEKDRRGMSVELLLKISDLFRCSPVELLGIKGQGGKTA